MVADPKHFLEFLEGGVGMPGNAGLEFFGVELAPMAPTRFRGQRSGLRGIPIPINRTPRQIKTPGGPGFGTPVLNEFHHPFPQVQCISFHAHNPITLCPNVNMNYYNVSGAKNERTYVRCYGDLNFCPSIVCNFQPRLSVTISTAPELRV